MAKVQHIEYFFQYLFYVLFIGAWYHTDTEAKNILGRTDLVVYYDNARKTLNSYCDKNNWATRTGPASRKTGFCGK
jgi:hypothetical protein